MGDDLTELILQYLTFEDKVRLECVSKQWRRLVYNKQFVIELLPDSKRTKNSLDCYQKFQKNYPSINRKALESFLKKCPNITKVSINREVDSSVLSLIGQYCHRIKSLNLNEIMIDDNVLSFFRMYGHKLEELYVLNSGKKFEDTTQIIEFCENLRTINFKHLVYYYDHAKISNELKLLSDKYSKAIKTLYVYPFGVRAEELKTSFDCIYRFENLQSLTLIIEITEPIDDCLSLIGQKCNKLMKLDLKLFESVPISNRFFDIFSEFKAMEKLKIDIMPKNTVKGSVECFKHCKQLKHLDINCPKLREDFFANIASFVPKLQSLRIRTDYPFSVSFVNNFHTMKYIQRISIQDYHWYFGKCLSEVLLSPNRNNVIRINENCGYL